MKKLFALLLAMMMLLTFAACSNDGQTVGDTSIPASVTPTDEEPADEPEEESGDPGEITVAEDPEEVATIVPEPSDATPLMWRVTCPDDQTMYLFGSIHVAGPTMYPLPHVIMDAFYAADYLAVEADTLAFINDRAAVMEYSFATMYDDGRTIVDEIGEELYARAVEAVEALNLGIPIELLDIYKPFVWWNDILTAAAIELSGLSAEFGLDLFFLEKAYELGMGILEVESIMEQIELLLGFSAPLQMLMLEGALDIELAAEAVIELYESYKYGDLESFILMRKAILEETPAEIGEEYYQGLLVNRDIGMADAIEQYFEEGKNVFYVVGLLHMVGEGGIIDLLIQRGYIVELVEIV
ncbi:MAG: TraB/GumN family protein [Oscillospiraceae bacterium]|jgi:uncharacterized protein YbaP (TraB family)|nr:TraB/GumN family protein [Oscillospiraceae bacterium]